MVSYYGLRFQINQSLERHHNTGQKRLYEFCLFSIRILRKKKSQFIGPSIMSRYPNPVYDQFVAKLNLQLKPHANDIKIRPNFIHVAISP
jgi:hypothetical protein